MKIFREIDPPEAVAWALQRSHPEWDEIWTTDSIAYTVGERDRWIEQGPGYRAVSLTGTEIITEDHPHA